MSEVLQANVFFFITSVAVVLFTMLLCVALYHVIKIIKSIRRIVERIESGSDVIAEDISQLRAYVLEGSLVSQIIGFFLGSRRPSRRRRRSRKETYDDDLTEE